MNHDQAFREAILTNPDDNMPRLVYADWLEEHGDPRAEFIRVQCTVAQLPDGPERRALEARAQQLLSQHGPEWAGPIRRMEVRGAVAFRRGWIESLTVSTRDLLRHADELFRVALIRHLGLFKARPEHMQPLAELPYLAGVSTLDFDNGPYSYDYGNHFDTAGAQALASSPYLTRLTALNLRWNRIGDEGVRALAASPYMGRLTTLNLFDTGTVSSMKGPTGLSLASILPLLALPCLTDLDLGCNRLGANVVRALAASPHLARLTALKFSQNDIGDAEVEALAASPYVAGLTTLDLRCNGIDTAEEKALRNSPYLTRLTTLELAGNPCGPEILNTEGWTAADYMAQYG
jgi:uncharacterized protein (TIGR02996 family)